MLTDASKNGDHFFLVFSDFGSSKKLTPKNLFTWNIGPKTISVTKSTLALQGLYSRTLVENPFIATEIMRECSNIESKWVFTSTPPHDIYAPNLSQQLNIATNRQPTQIFRKFYAAKCERTTRITCMNLTLRHNAPI